MFDNRNYSPASPEEREETQMMFGMVCLGFLAVIALVVQLIGGFMVAWTVIGSMCLIAMLTIGCLMRVTKTERRNRF
jgi:hypothetical protein